MIFPAIGLALLAHKVPRLPPTTAGTAILHPRCDFEASQTGKGEGERNHADECLDRGNATTANMKL